MAPIARFFILVPLVLALVSFVLTSLVLFAGHKQGFMEDYAVVRVCASFSRMPCSHVADSIPHSSTRP